MILAACVACGSPPSDTPGPRHNLVVITPDSLRADRLALWNSTDGLRPSAADGLRPSAADGLRPSEADGLRPSAADGVRTPNLERLADRGRVFLNTWAVAPWTAPSVVSLFTGLYPPSHGVVYRDDTTPPTLPTLPRLASAQGYRVGNFSFFAGISYFRNLGFPPAALGLEHGRETEAFSAWLQLKDGGQGEPFFAWIHLLEPHLPYGATGYQATEVRIPGSSGLERSQLQATVPVGSVEFDAGDRQALVSLYDDDLVKLDEAIGRILAALEAAGVVERTVIVVMADHGEELLEDGWVGHASTAIEAKLIPEVLHIPLILAGPGVPPGRSLDLAQHVDVLPTLTALLDWPQPLHLDGLDLLAGVRQEERGFLARLLRPAARRQWAFFDSSPGGNLTPQERRGERLQGLSDGTCLLTLETLPGKPGRPRVEALAAGAHCDPRALSQSLDRWRRQQAEQRLAVLELQPELPPPPESEVSGYAASLPVVEPQPDQALAWDESSAQVVLEWQGEGTTYWIQYDIGQGMLRVEGSFQVEQKRLVFGPFPQGFWNDLAGYSPFRYRILDPQSRKRSPWQTFRVLPVEAH